MKKGTRVLKYAPTSLTTRISGARMPISVERKTEIDLPQKRGSATDSVAGTRQSLFDNVSNDQNETGKKVPR